MWCPAASGGDFWYTLFTHDSALSSRYGAPPASKGALLARISALFAHDDKFRSKYAAPHMEGLGGSRLGWWELVDSRLRSMMQPKVVRSGSKIQRTEGLGGFGLEPRTEEAWRLQARRRSSTAPD